jgi:hypothetical protein
MAGPKRNMSACSARFDHVWCEPGCRSIFESRANKTRYDPCARPKLPRFVRSDRRSVLARFCIVFRFQGMGASDAAGMVQNVKAIIIHRRMAQISAVEWATQVTGSREDYVRKKTKLRFTQSMTPKYGQYFPRQVLEDAVRIVATGASFNRDKARPDRLRGRRRYPR